MKKYHYLMFLIPIIVLIIVACNEKDDDTTPAPKIVKFEASTPFIYLGETVRFDFEGVNYASYTIFFGDGNRKDGVYMDENHTEIPSTNPKLYYVGVYHKYEQDNEEGFEVTLTLKNNDQEVSTKLNHRIYVESYP